MKREALEAVIKALKFVEARPGDYKKFYDVAVHIAVELGNAGFKVVRKPAKKS
jgi:hypothetical protein